MEPILDVRDVTICYEGRPAVEHVSFTLNRGETLCLVGSNGSGKSTLIKGILGLTPLSDGEVRVLCGRSKLAYLAQIHTAERAFPATVGEIVLSGTQRSGRRLPFYTAKDKARARQALALLKIEDLANRPIGSLSGGQQQRALLARAIAQEIELLVLDEPCSALDPRITQELYELFDTLRQTLRLAMLISTHDWQYVHNSGSRVLELNHTTTFLGDGSQWPRGSAGEETVHG